MKIHFQREHKREKAIKKKKLFKCSSVKMCFQKQFKEDTDVGSDRVKVHFNKMLTSH